MASDAYMELSDPETWGETFDSQFGEDGRAQGAFEISQFVFGVVPADDDDEEEDPKKSGKGHSAHGAHGAHGSRGAGAIGRAAKHRAPTVKTFTIHKPIDKGSLDLFLACLENKRMDWAKIFVREMGDVSQQPWLWLEFKGVRVEKFDWSLTPGAGGDEAKDQETVEFSFETILIKYSKQDNTGTHKAVKIKGWNRLKHNRQHDELEKDVRTHTFDSDDQ